MQKKLKTITLHTVGWTLIPVGGLGLVLPIIPGIVSIFLGLAILARVSPTMAARIARLRTKNRYFDIAFGKLDIVSGRFFTFFKL